VYGHPLAQTGGVHAKTVKGTVARIFDAGELNEGVCQERVGMEIDGEGRGGARRRRGAAAAAASWQVFEWSEGDEQFLCQGEEVLRLWDRRLMRDEEADVLMGNVEEVLALWRGGTAAGWWGLRVARQLAEKETVDQGAVGREI